MTVALERYVGPDIARVQGDLAALRVAVFREYPYLYEGTPDYEAQYLQTYLKSKAALAVVVRHGEKAAGATTGLPLADEQPEFRAPFEQRGYDVGSVFYLGESVLLPPYRGRGLGVRFFQEREAHARRHGYRMAAFAAVERPEDHPARPRDYTPLHDFWRKRGYERHPELATTFTWKDVGEATETAKPMVFWLKNLEEA